MKKLIGTFLPIMTNGDRIRSMSDEELAAAMTATFVDEQIHYCQNKQECIDAMDRGDIVADEKCISCLVAWLRQPAEEVQNK